MSRQFIPICKIDKAKRIITAVVMPAWDGDPATAEESEDSQGDVATVEAIEAAMIKFMKKRAAGKSFFGDMHGDEAAPLILIESWQTRGELTMDDQEIPVGSWLMSLFADDDDLWARFESRELDGLSIRGDGLRTEV